MPIKTLPPLLVNQIAAGEVIERPASVVKELVENALDAAATRIDVAIEDGGRQLIRVADNGLGIAEDQLLLALSPHATSKIDQPDDLSAIGTFGFRGEALASAASVARLRLSSRPTVAGQIAEAGSSVEISGDQVGPTRPEACAPGTVVEVRDLFFNTPARRKFLRGAATEFGHIRETVTRLAMVQAGVAFRFTHNDRRIFDLPIVSGPEARRRRCLELLGDELDEALLEFEQIDPAAHDGAALWGLAGLPSIARATAKFQYVWLNGRPIRNRGVSHAVKEAYRGLIPPDRQPVVVLMIDLDPATVDVNVHPAKAEVRFRDPTRMHGLVLHALRQCLLATDLTPQASLTDRRWGGSVMRSTDTGFHVNSGSGGGFDGGFKGDFGGSSGSGGGAIEVDPERTRAFVDYFKRMDPKQKGFVYQQVKAELAQHQPEALLNDATAPGAGSPNVLPIEPTAKSSSILQVHKSYLVTQDDQGILIIDQHALHERVMFEQLRRRILAGDLESQRLLMPAVIRVSADRLALLAPLAPLLKRLGVEAAEFGENDVAVHAFPTFLFDRKVDPAAFMHELLDRAVEGSIDPAGLSADDGACEAVLHEVLDMMSCKAAVKAGDPLNEAELSALLAQRDEVERASNCPHGRPTSIRLSLRDLARRFGRT